ncbi:hypothetical protein LKM00_27865 [Bacillus wiedmannii]|uniref:hypothetical protein n=1 Tax=Bacillus wiedmannii TaxID=1890302 RepID=UPI001E4C7BA5|nr:hypothetical protein [Bacillus wiedmannii]MCC2381214.1 hypothetical protein [Bacillus wiedmannii]MCC2425555.1 hypothetical protein [Bacillus wiedmannii]
MALLVDKVINNGIEVRNVYARVDTIQGNKDKIEFSLNYYVNREQYKGGFGYLKQELYSYKPNVLDTSANFFKQAYDFLKTLDEFKNALSIDE